VNGELREWFESTKQATALWPPALLRDLHRVITASTEEEREQVVMVLLANYTKAVMDDAQQRWIRV
jgi:hypothetical protein